jgi:hypothetical protein
MRILITGDSFAADWQKKYPEQIGWPNLLSNLHAVTNLAQAGCSEYRIYKQIISSDLDQFDFIIVSHTSPYRIYTEYHPNRVDDVLHGHCDLLYSDIEELAKTNPEYLSAVEYFKKFFSLEYADFCHKLILDKINALLENRQAIHLSHIVQTTNSINFSDLFKTHRGLINHYNDEGNQIIYKKIIEELPK